MNPGTKPTFRADGEFAIHVTDLQKSENFYGQVLGFRLLGKTDHQLIYDAGAIRLYVNLDDHVTPFIPALEVPNLAEAKEVIVKNGATIIKEFEGGRALYFTDPFGITIDLVQKGI